ncbi:hypothetical protein N431DRAFT_427040 [Stipitochalara longipes BDJ]|nr:hypothetical protein N431DRAFT_427040 [Stipitochalara longipes BDJ]
MTQPSSHSQASSLLTPTPKTFTPPISDRPTSMALSSSLPHASTMTAPTFHTFTPPRSHAPTSTVSGSKRARNQSLSSSSDDSMRSRLKKRAKDSNGETRSAQRHNSSRSSMVQPSGGMQAEPNSRRPGGQAATLLATPFSNAVPGFSTSATPFRPQELGSPATTSPQAWQEHPTFGMHVEQRRTASPDEEEEDTKN